MGTFSFTQYVDGTQNAWLPVGNPLLVPGADALSMVMKITRITGDVEASAGSVLFATRPDQASSDPSPATGSFTSTNGDVQHYSVALDTQTTQFYVQPGVIARTGGGAAGFVQGTLQVVLGTCGRLAGQRDIEAFLFEESTRACSRSRPTTRSTARRAPCCTPTT